MVNVGKTFLNFSMVVRQKREVKKCWSIEEGDVGEDCKEGFVNK